MQVLRHVRIVGVMPRKICVCTLFGIIIIYMISICLSRFDCAVVRLSRQLIGLSGRVFVFIDDLLEIEKGICVICR